MHRTRLEQAIAQRWEVRAAAARIRATLSNTSYPSSRHPGICEANVRDPESPAKPRAHPRGAHGERSRTTSGQENLSALLPHPSHYPHPSHEEPGRYRSVCEEVAPEDGRGWVLRSSQSLGTLIQASRTKKPVENPHWPAFLERGRSRELMISGQGLAAPKSSRILLPETPAAVRGGRKRPNRNQNTFPGAAAPAAQAPLGSHPNCSDPGWQCQSGYCSMEVRPRAIPDMNSASSGIRRRKKS